MLKEAWGVLSYLPWLQVNVFRSGGILLDFLKEQMVLFPNHQLAQRGWQTALAPRLCTLPPVSLCSPQLCFNLCPHHPPPLEPPYVTVAAHHWRDVWPAEQIGGDICQTWWELVENYCVFYQRACVY